MRKSILRKSLVLLVVFVVLVGVFGGGAVPARSTNKAVAHAASASKYGPSPRRSSVPRPPAARC